MDSIEFGTTEKLHDVNFLNPDYGLVVGDNGTVLLTTDGGSSGLILIAFIFRKCSFRIDPAPGHYCSKHFDNNTFYR